MSERSNKKKRFIATVEKEVEITLKVQASNPKEAYRKYLELTKDPANLRKIIKENGKTIRSEIIGINLVRDAKDAHKAVLISEVPQPREPIVNNVLSMQDYLNRPKD